MIAAIQPDLIIRRALLDGLDASALFESSIGHRTGGEWQPPSLDELASLLPGYEFEKLIARGGMGAVYLAHQPALARRVAVKLLPLEISENAEVAERFRHEARTLARLRDPNIVTLFESGTTRLGHLWFSMDFVDGPDLARRLREGPLPLAEALAILKQVAAAIGHAHAEGVVHRDLKPSNILLAADGAKVADFGLARLDAPDERLTRTGTALGTWEYAAPEQAAGTALDARADIYSLGVIAYELLTGTLPRGVFDAPSQRDAALDPAFDGVVLRAMQSDPAQRFATAVEFTAALDFAADRRAQAEARQRVLREKLRRRTRIAAAVSLLLLAALGGLAFGWWKNGESIRHAAAAEVQARRATVARHEAEGIIEYLLTDLKPRLERHGRLKDLDAVLGRVEQYYTTHEATDGGDPRFRGSQAEFYKTKAGVQLSIGKFGEGIASHERALQIRESLAAGKPADIAHARRVGDAIRQLGNACMTASQYPRALEFHRRARDHAASIAARTGDAGDALSVAKAWKEMGAAISYLPDFPEATQQYEESQRRIEALLRDAPDSAELLDEITVLHASFGSLLEAQGDFAGALRHFEEMDAFIVAAIARGKGGSHNRAGSHFRVGVALHGLGRFDEALARFREAILASEKNSAANPGSVFAKNDLAWNYKHIAEIHAQRNQRAEYDEAFAKFLSNGGERKRLSHTLPDK